jgi:hypothetical protein
VPRIKYAATKLGEEKRRLIDQANQIISQYQAQGLDLTLRQVFYQFVSRDLFPASWADPKTGSTNSERSYKKLGEAISDGRMCGLIDWEAIVDRTRFVRQLACWGSPSEIVAACARQFRLDKWARQPAYLEVWIEKDALVGVIEGVCNENAVSYLACRGYASVSEVWKAGYERLLPRLNEDKQVTILYLGDHDPSGIDMTRDVQKRLQLFTASANSPLTVEVERLALNMDQIELYDPPPNPTKVTDSRAGPYIEQFGQECWELDALDPVVIRDLIENAIHSRRDDALWAEAVREENRAKKHLAGVAENWQDVVDALP